MQRDHNTYQHSTKMMGTKWSSRRTKYIRTFHPISYDPQWTDNVPLPRPLWVFYAAATARWICSDHKTESNPPPNLLRSRRATIYRVDIIIIVNIIQNIQWREHNVYSTGNGKIRVLVPVPGFVLHKHANV